MLAGLETAICYQMTMSSLSSMAAVQKPNAGAKVKLRYEARLMDGTLFDERGEGQPSWRRSWRKVRNVPLHMMCRCDWWEQQRISAWLFSALHFQCYALLKVVPRLAKSEQSSRSAHRCNWFVPAARNRPSRQSLYSSSLPGGRQSLLGDVLCTEQLSEGLEQAIMKMKVGEKAEIAIQPQYAFGAEAQQAAAGRRAAAVDVVYTLELVDMEKVRLCDPRTAGCVKAVCMAPAFNSTFAARQCLAVRLLIKAVRAALMH